MKKIRKKKRPVARVNGAENKKKKKKKITKNSSFGWLELDLSPAVREN